MSCVQVVVLPTVGVPVMTMLGSLRGMLGRGDEEGWEGGKGRFQPLEWSGGMGGLDN